MRDKRELSEAGFLSAYQMNLSYRLTICKYLVIIIVITVLCFSGFEGIKIIAGKTTTFNLLTKVIINLVSKGKIASWVSYIFGVSGVGYGLEQKRLRGKTLKDTNSHSAKLEQIIDSNRSSSHLTSAGTTPPGDL